MGEPYQNADNFKLQKLAPRERVYKRNRYFSTA